MTLLDTSTPVGALLVKHPQHAACLRAMEDAADPLSNAHALGGNVCDARGLSFVPRNFARRSVELSAVWLVWGEPAQAVKTTSERVNHRAR
jgi:hypothetical protein